MKLGERAMHVHVPGCGLFTRQDGQSHTSSPALELHCPHKTDPKVWLSHQLGNAALQLFSCTGSRIAAMAGAAMQP